MPIIALVGNKGGAGKTTLSVNIAAGIARKHSTAVLDADPQGSSLQWRAFTDDDGAISVFEATNDLADQIGTLKDQYECLVIDCPPSVHAPQTNTVLQSCDIALIPVQPSPVDLWATVHTERAIEQAREVNPQLRAMLILNQLETRTTLSRLVREAAEQIELPVAKTGIRRRAIYRATALEGKSVFDIGRRGADAVEELDNLLDEVLY
jgi:chromosome partitioning protein